MIQTEIRIRIEGPDNEAEVTMTSFGDGYYETEKALLEAAVPSVLRAYFGYSLEDESDEEEKSFLTIEEECDYLDDAGWWFPK